MPYLILLVIILFFSYYVNINSIKIETRYLNSIALFFVTFIILLFFGLRYNVGKDYLSYYNVALYKSYNEQTDTIHFEPGFRLLYYISDFFLLPPNTIFFLGGTILFVFFIRSFYEKSSNFLFSFFLFFSLGFFFDSLNIFRQYIAISVVFYGYVLCDKKDKFGWYICLFIAFLFHRSSLITLPVFYLCKKCYKRRFLNFILLLSIFFFKFSSSDIFISLLSIGPSFFKQLIPAIKLLKLEGAGITTLFYILIGILINNSKQRDVFFKENQFWLNLYIFSCFILSLFRTNGILLRLANYFTISITVVLPYFFKKTSNKNYLIVFFKSFIIMFLVINFIKYAFLSPSDNLLTYRTIFSR